jgi:hypothetical protein
LVAILQDYEEYLSEERLLDERGRWMAIFPCGQSLKENVEFGLYYEAQSRPSKHTPLIGIYADKAVRFVGQVESVGLCELRDGTLQVESERGQVTEAQRARALAAIEATKYYDLKSEPLRFYFVPKFEETLIEKASPGGIMGFRYLDVWNLAGGSQGHADWSAADWAAALRGQRFS